MESQQSALRLILSFFGVNLLIAGLFVVLVPHEVIARIASRARRVRHTGLGRPNLGRTDLGRPSQPAPQVRTALNT